MTTLVERLRDIWGTQLGKEAADRIEELERQLAESQEKRVYWLKKAATFQDQCNSQAKQIALLRDALEAASNAFADENLWEGCALCNKALASIDDSKLLDGLVLCDAEPHTRCEYTDDNGMLHSIIFPEPLYARRTK